MHVRHERPLLIGSGYWYVSTSQQQHYHGRYATGSPRHCICPDRHFAAGWYLIGHGPCRHPVCSKKGCIPGRIGQERDGTGSRNQSFHSSCLSRCLTHLCVHRIRCRDPFFFWGKGIGRHALRFTFVIERSN